MRKTRAQIHEGERVGSGDETSADWSLIIVFIVHEKYFCPKKQEMSAMEDYWIQLKGCMLQDFVQQNYSDDSYAAKGA